MGSQTNRGLDWFPCWSWGVILGLYFLELGLQMDFRGLNFKVTTGVALRGL
jgi:hypothetical protein